MSDAVAIALITALTTVICALFVALDNRKVLEVYDLRQRDKENQAAAAALKQAYDETHQGVNPEQERP